MFRRLILEPSLLSHCVWEGSHCLRPTSPRDARCASILWWPCVTSRKPMSLLRNITSGLRSLFRKDQLDRELNEELSAYLEMEAAEKMKQGMSCKDALRAVRLERGSLELSKEIIRSGGWESFVETCWQDLRFSF